MAIQFQCSCGKAFRVKDELAGKTGKCPNCGAVLEVPSPSMAILPTLEEDTAPPGASTAATPDQASTTGLSRLDIGCNQTCPSCGRAYPGTTTVCWDCGIDMATGERVRRRAPRRTITVPWKPILVIVGIVVVAIGGYAVYENYLSDLLRGSGKTSPRPGGGGSASGAKQTTKGALGGFTRARIRGQVSLTRTHFRSVATAIEAFYVDHNVYPPFATGAQSVNGDLGQDHPAFPLPTFCRPDPSGRLKTLLGPSDYVYIKELPRDPFSEGGKATFMYWCVVPGQPHPSGRIVLKPREGYRYGWILISAGPDGDYDFAGEWDLYDPPVERYSRDRRYEQQNRILHTQMLTRLHTGRNRRGSALTYDPTNGLVSDGDIWRVKL